MVLPVMPFMWVALSSVIYYYGAVFLMSLAQVAWDKYSLPLFASLWLLSAGWNRSAPPTRAPASDDDGREWRVGESPSADYS